MWYHRIKDKKGSDAMIDLSNVWCCFSCRGRNRASGMLENVKMVMQKLNLFFPTLTSFIHHTSSANRNRYRSSKMLELNDIATLYSTPKLYVLRIMCCCSFWYWKKAYITMALQWLPLRKYLYGWLNINKKIPGTSFNLLYCLVDVKYLHIPQSCFRFYLLTVSTKV